MVTAWRTLTGDIGIDDMIRENGWLSVYRTDKSFAGAREELVKAQNAQINGDSIFDFNYLDLFRKTHRLQTH